MINMLNKILKITKEWGESKIKNDGAHKHSHSVHYSKKDCLYFIMRTFKE